MKNLMAFTLVRSEIRTSPALSRLCERPGGGDPLVNGARTVVVASGKRRWVDAHWLRGNSYFRIGWNWVKGCLHQDWQLFPTISLLGHPDPAPAIASKKQDQQQFEREFTVKSYQFAA